MAFGTNIGMAPDGIHGGVELPQTGNRLPPMALAAGDLGPDYMDISGISGMALGATALRVEIDPPMGILQIGPFANLFGIGAEAENSFPGLRDFGHTVYRIGVLLQNLHNNRCSFPAPDSGQYWK